MMNDETEPPAFVDRVLTDAVRDGATDVFWLPLGDQMQVRAKAPSGTTDVASVPAVFGQQCVARLKVLAGLLTYRSAVAQDGAIHGLADCPGVELRVATLPTRSGERVTVRVLKRGARPRLLDELGYAEQTLARLRALLAKPTGMLVLTGPTGSGKTTTIYAMIRELVGTGHNAAGIITIEDPVEGDLEGISQVQLRHGDEEWGYGEALRAALRHDVKTLVIGELRDREVAKVALDAALTGHRVITTYHAGDIPSVYARLLHQEFEPFLVAAAVRGVVSQRLLPSADGKGVVPAAAVLESSDAWRDLIVQRPGLGELREHARTVPGADLEAEARALAEAGVISRKDALIL